MAIPPPKSKLISSMIKDLGQHPRIEEVAGIRTEYGIAAPMVGTEGVPYFGITAQVQVTDMPTAEQPNPPMDLRYRTIKFSAVQVGREDLHKMVGQLIDLYEREYGPYYSMP